MPGIIRLSPAAWEEARAFDAEVQRIRPGQDWVVSFDWTKKSVREPGSDVWVDLGSGIDLGAYERWKVPDGATEIVDGLEIAIKVPEEVYSSVAERLIDVDKSARDGFVLK